MAAPLFGLNVSIAASPGADPIADARLAERLGFDFVSASDHLHGDSPTFEPWTLLTSIAAATATLRVASRVLAVPYRNPAVLAKMAETLDRLSGGRLILGLGGGYLDDEFRAFGLRVPTPRDKVDGVAETMWIARGLWSEPSFTFEGRLYRTEDARLTPKPEHRIPIWLGMYKPRGLALTGRMADGWIPSYGFAPPDEVKFLRKQVLAAARDAGRDPEEITCVYNLEIRVEESRVQPSDGLSGTPDVLVDRLIELRRMGFSAFNVVAGGPDRAEQIERLASEVLPAVRDHTI
jgi:alkanesulfonate monooxygenase SsuD/methylene tetrahydromethanopterin reductase-like flavin-dependent oxidoreductase (luciferase family)